MTRPPIRNSGSPVYDLESGEVLGIINMVLVKAGKESVLAQPSGISYAIPVSHLVDMIAARRRWRSQPDFPGST